MWGSIISTLGGLAGGLLNRNSAQDAQSRVDNFNRTKIQTTVKDARRAGIHPLAALGSPVAGSWATPVSQPSMGDAVADGANAIARSFPNADAKALLSAQLNTERAKAANLDSDTARNLADAQRTTLTAAARRGGQTLDTADLVARGSPVKISGEFSDTQDFTNRYGEMADFIFGPLVAEADLRKNTGMSVGGYGMQQADRVADTVRQQLDHFTNNLVNRGSAHVVDWLRRQRSQSGYGR